MTPIDCQVKYRIPYRRYVRVLTDRNLKLWFFSILVSTALTHSHPRGNASRLAIDFFSYLSVGGASLLIIRRMYVFISFPLYDNLPKADTYWRCQHGDLEQK